MHFVSTSQFLTLGLLVTAPLASAYAEPSNPQDMAKRYVGGPAVWARSLIHLESRHHTEAQIAAQKAKAAKAKAGARDVEVIEAREPHHTEGQIAAKKAKAAKNGRDIESRLPHHTEAQIAAKKAKAAKNGARDVEIEEREASPQPHHTEAQIAAKKAKTAKGN